MIHCLFLPAPAMLVDTRAGEVHQVPPEVIEQAEPGELFETVAAWARKIHLISENSQFQVARAAY